LVVLVDHDVEADFIREQPLVVVAVQQIAGDFGIELAIWFTRSEPSWSFQTG
jgi:hypothetical protein